MRIVGILVLIASVYAGHAPYLGGDIKELIEQTKDSNIRAQGTAHKPVTEKQKRDASVYNSKFTDIAKAYAEGYKAAIKAVQVRAVIAKKRLLNSKYAIRAKSTIPYNVPNNPYLKKMNTQNIQKSTVPINTINNELSNNPENRAARSNLPSFDTAIEAQAAKYANNMKLRNDRSMAAENPQQRATNTRGLSSRSTIPMDNMPAMNMPMDQKSDIPSMNNYFRRTSPSTFFPYPKQVNGIEKSWIPMGPSDRAHDIVERSAPIIKFRAKQPYHPAFSAVPVELRSEEERNKIAKLNNRALGHHRNVYFDSAGGDPFNGGGVLSQQNVIYKKKHRKRRSSEDEKNDTAEKKEFVPKKHLVRHRRSHMPYLGQNLDALGIIRAQPRSWTAQKKSVPAQINFPAPPVPEPSYSYLQHPQPAYVNQPGYSLPGVYRANIPQPMGYQPPLVPMNMGQQQYPGIRNTVPNIPASYNQMQSSWGYPYPMQLQNGLLSEDSGSIESKGSSTERMKKSIQLEPGVV